MLTAIVARAPLTIYEPILFDKLCIAMQNRSIGVNVVREGISLPYAEGSADFLGNHDTTQIVYPTNNSCCFHISFSFYDTFDGRQVAAPTL